MLPPMMGGSKEVLPPIWGVAQNPQGGAAPPQIMGGSNLILGGSISFWGGAQGGALFLRIQSAPPQTGGSTRGSILANLAPQAKILGFWRQMLKKYANFIKLRQIIVKLAPQAKILRIGIKILKITSAPPQNGGEHRGEQNFENSGAPPPNWTCSPPKLIWGNLECSPPKLGGAQGGAFSMSGGSRGERSPPSCGARHRPLP